MAKLVNSSKYNDVAGAILSLKGVVSVQDIIDAIKQTFFVHAFTTTSPTAISFYELTQDKGSWKSLFFIIIIMVFHFYGLTTFSLLLSMNFLWFSYSILPFNFMV